MMSARLPATPLAGRTPAFDTALLDCLNLPGVVKHSHALFGLMADEHGSTLGMRAGPRSCVMTPRSGRG